MVCATLKSMLGLHRRYQGFNFTRRVAAYARLWNCLSSVDIEEAAKRHR